MNYSTAVMLFNTNIRAIKVTYEPDQPQQQPKRYNFKTLDETIKAEDLVVVATDTRHGMTVVKVEEVDIDIDPDDDTEIKWIVSKVQTSEYKHVLDEEKKWIEQLKASEKRRKREEIKKNMLEMYKDSGIEALPITNMQSEKAVEAIEDSKKK